MGSFALKSAMVFASPDFGRGHLVALQVLFDRVVKGSICAVLFCFKDTMVVCSKSFDREEREKY